MALGTILQYLLVAVVLIFFYWKVIRPFSKRMLELPVKDKEPERPEIRFDDDFEENDEENAHSIKSIKDRYKRRLALQEMANQEESMKYDTLKAHLRKMVGEHPDNVANVLERLEKKDN